MADALNILDRGKPYILAQSAVPVCLAPNGTVAVNGIVTLGTALPTTYSGGIWLRLPAGAVVGGLAGLYWAVMTSTTQGQVYTAFVDPATQFIPYIPGGLVAAVGSNAAYTQTTGADITLVNVTVPGGAMGENGGIRSAIIVSLANTAGAKTTLFKHGGTQFALGNSPASVVSARSVAELRNRGSQSLQIAPPAASSLGTAYSGTGSGISPYYGTKDASASQALTVTENIAVATDFVVIESSVTEILPS